MKAVLASLLIPALAQVAVGLPATVPNSSVRISDIVYGGTGCNQGTLSPYVNGAGTVVGLTFSDFTASIGSNVPITEIRKNCQVNLAVNFPAGYSFSVFSVEYDGYAKLDNGVTGTVKSNYYFSGQTDQVSTAIALNGPYEGNYQKTDVGAVSVWSPCGATQGLLNINSQLVLDSDNDYAYGTLTQSKLDAKFQQLVGLRWRKC